MAHLLLTRNLPVLSADRVAEHATWYPVSEVLDGTLQLTFDHRQIFDDSMKRAKSRLDYSPLGPVFCGPEFTIAQPRAVHEAECGTRLDPRNFRREAAGNPGFLADTGRRLTGDAGPLAALFQLAEAARQSSKQPTRAVLNPPHRRPQG